MSKHDKNINCKGDIWDDMQTPVASRDVNGYDVEASW